MHKRDYLLKQFEEFSKVLAVIIGLKRNNDFNELNELINSTALKYTQTEILCIESKENEALINLLTVEKKLNDEQLKMLGDLLFEKGDYYSKSNENNEQDSFNCFYKATIIYKFLKQNATLSYSLDMHYKLEVLNKMGF